MTKAICSKHEWGYTLVEGCPWCPPQPRTRMYRKGEPVTDVRMGMVLRSAAGVCRVRAVHGGEAELAWSGTGQQSLYDLEEIQTYCTYAEDFEAPGDP